MAGSGQDWEESVGFQRQDQFLNLKRMRDREVGMHTTHTSRSQSQGGSHISHRRTPGTCNWRLTVFVGGYAASDEEGLPQILTLLLRTREMVAIGLGLEPLPVSFFRTIKTITMNEGVRVRHTKV